MTVCKQADEYLINFFECRPHWEVMLNNGEYIYQDDGRPNVWPISAWKRLRAYCEDNNLHIISMVFMFRDNRFSLPSNMDGYYFSLGARGMFGSPITMELFFLGTLQNGVLEVQCWKTPEMLHEYTEQRDPEKAGECLIKRNINQYTEQLTQSDQISI
jgi:hypothetical protein